MNKIILLAIGGAAGTLARYFLAGFVYTLCGTQFPYGTLAVNTSGCFLLGFLASIAEKKFLLGVDSRTLLMIGFCGAFTTFSTLIMETVNLLRDGEMVPAFMNIFLSVLAGLVVFWLGMLLGEMV